MVYYRIATQQQQTTAWEWESAFVNSLEALFHLGQQYDHVPAQHIRIFAATAVAYLDTLLARVNLGLPTNSLTLEQLLHDHQSITTPHVRRYEIELGWQEDREGQQSLFTLDPASETAVELDRLPVTALGRAVDTDFALGIESWESDHRDESSLSAIYIGLEQAVVGQHCCRF